MRCRAASSAAVVVLAACAASAGLLVAAGRAPAAAAKTCPPGFVHADLSWGEKCLRAGELCRTGSPEYRRYGFDCPAGHLVRAGGASTGTAPGSVDVGRTVIVLPRERSAGCRRGAVPDRRCSPGAYYSGLTRAVLCSAGFRTSSIRHVPQSEKYAVEREYGLPARLYGRTLEIDHIVPLELGGSNAIANLFPEPAGGRAGYHVKDLLENRLHALVCAGQMALRAAQVGIAANWPALYQRVFGVPPG